MNNFIDTVFNTAATDNKIKYKIIHADNTEEIVELQIYTPIEIEGTLQNKTFFDSIADDLNSRLPTSNKATNEEVIVGTNSNNYIVPSSFQAKLNKMNGYTGKLKELTSQTSAGNNTIFNISDIPDATQGLITIYGCYQLRYSTDNFTNFLTINGTHFFGKSILTGGSLSGYQTLVEGIEDTSNIVFDTYTNLPTSTVNSYNFMPFKIEINLNTKIMTFEVLGRIKRNVGTVSNPQYSYYTLNKTMVHFNSISSIVANLTSQSSRYSYLKYTIFYSK